jgi:hypothetical protein
MVTAPKRKADKRPTMTFKGDAFTPEFRAIINKAAKKRGLTQAEFVAEVLDREARKVLQGTPTDNPEDTPPPPAIIERIEDTDKKLTDLAEQVRLLTKLQQRTFWQKLTGR